MAEQAANPTNANPPYQYNDNVGSKFRAGAVSQRRQFAWLERSKYWPDLPQAEWRAEKVLGKGTYGLTGLWNYIGSNPNTPRQIAVKQSQGKYASALERESKMLHLTSSTGTDHVVKLYKDCYRAGGTGTFVDDPLPYRSGSYREDLEVVRIYMEYAPGGDAQALYNLIRSNSDYVIPEEHLWRMLECFASACLVLRAICHFDLKLENILIGGYDTETHQRFPAFKLADFGISTFTPISRQERRLPNWINGAQWRATPQWMSPEQYHEIHPNRDISEMTNVWGIGALIHRLITNQMLDITRSFMHKASDGSSYRSALIVQYTADNNKRPSTQHNLQNFPTPAPIVSNPTNKPPWPPVRINLSPDANPHELFFKDAVPVPRIPEDVTELTPTP
ncbi:hypothetical protein EG329_003543 [Mollisiaceae sp. DMI_Dod_QoI]|nr:hypothetical protein EG329_003543 [Helotiales sp. DMI_Dod_QoI]